MTFEALPKTTSFMWVFPADEKPLHKEIVMGHTPKGVMEVWYSVRECGWFDLECHSVKVINWKKTLYLSDEDHVVKTRFFKKVKA
jgi:hypothetical protein